MQESRIMATEREHELVRLVKVTAGFSQLCPQLYLHSHLLE